MIPRHFNRRLPTVLFALVVMATTGCVSSSKYYTATAERDQVADQKAELQGELEVADIEIGALEDRVENQQKTLQHLRSTYGQIVEQLENEVTSGAIEVEMMKHGVNVRISEEILFGSGSADLGEQGVALIRRLADKLKATPYQVVVGGHSDNVPIGGELAKIYRTNWDLAGARSAHVVDVMHDAGVPPVQLLSVSYGETRPLASNDTPEGRATNRRIEVRIRPINVEAEMMTP
jgi:chemotaxis protein MotB